MCFRMCLKGLMHTRERALCEYTCSSTSVKIPVAVSALMRRSLTSRGDPPEGISLQTNFYDAERHVGTHKAVADRHQFFPPALASSPDPSEARVRRSQARNKSSLPRSGGSKSLFCVLTLFTLVPIWLS